MENSARAYIQLKALTNNWRLLKQLAPKEQPLIPVLKANAYGHGLTIVALHLQKLGAKSAAVARVFEAMELRTAGFKGKILLLGPFHRSDLSYFAKYRITPIVGNLENLQLLITEAKKYPPLEIQLKWDTSMNRLGIKPESFDKVVKLLRRQTRIKVEGVCTHFLSGEDLGNRSGASLRQVFLFNEIAQKLKMILNLTKLELHIYNSDAFFRQAQGHYVQQSFGARIGLALYGYSTVKNKWTRKLQPVMRFVSCISQIKRIKKGESVSYGATWVAKRDSTIAVVPVGYADGYRRALSNKGQVFIKGMRVNIVGIICMDYFMIDVTDLIKKRPLDLGDEVELWGNHMELSQLAYSIGTIPYEMLTGVGPRVARVAV